MRDVWQILFSRWRNVQWRMITQFSKRSIDLFVLRILKEKWFFTHPVCQEEAVFLQLNGLQHHYRIRQRSLCPFHAEKLSKTPASDLLERKKAELTGLRFISPRKERENFSTLMDYPQAIILEHLQAF